MPTATKNSAMDSKLLLSQAGELLIYGDIGDWWSGNDALTLAQEIEAIDGDEINVRIHSPGGYILEGLVIYNRLKHSTKTVNIHIDGLAASMASVIAMAGDKISMPSNAWLMIHKPINAVWGNADDMRKMADTLDGFEADLTNIYMSRYSGSREDLAQMLADETWINAQDALAMGFIDEIVEPVKAAASMSMTAFSKAPAGAQALFGNNSPAQPATATGALPMPDVIPPVQAPAVAPQAAAVTPTPATSPVAPAAGDVQAAVEAALAARAQISQQITALAKSVRLSQPEIDALTAQNLTLDKAREAILEVVAKRDAGQQPVNHVTVSNNTGTLREDVAKGLMVRAGLADKKEGNDFALMSLSEIARSVCVANGISVSGQSHGAIATLAMHSTSDFPSILADVANKSLRAGYDAYPRTFLPFSRKVSASDFKNINRVQLGEAPALEKVGQSGEFKHGSMGEGKESYKLETYGKIISLTRQTIINDDLDAFTRIPQSFGDAGADLENSVVWGLLTSNVKLADGVALFHANHANLGTGGAISETTLSEARLKMRTQKGINATRPLNLKAQFLIVPAALETTAQKLLSAIVAAQSSNVNPFQNSMDLIVEPLLDVASATAWYMSAAPSRIDTIEYAYLSGEEGIYIETKSGFEVDGVQIKARLDFGAGVIDHRGLLKNNGA